MAITYSILGGFGLCSLGIDFNSFQRGFLNSGICTLNLLNMLSNESFSSFDNMGLKKKVKTVFIVLVDTLISRTSYQLSIIVICCRAVLKPEDLPNSLCYSKCRSVSSYKFLAN